MFYITIQNGGGKVLKKGTVSHILTFFFSANLFAGASIMGDEMQGVLTEFFCGNILFINLVIEKQICIHTNELISSRVAFRVFY